MLLKPPFIIYCLFMELAETADRETATRRLNVEDCSRCMTLLNSDDLHLLHADLDEIFHEFELDVVDADELGVR